MQEYDFGTLLFGPKPTESSTDFGLELFGPPSPPPEGGFIPAVQRGFLQTGILLGDILPAMAARLVGADKYAEKQFQEAAETQKKIESKYAAAVPSYKDIKDVGSAVTYITESVGELLPSILPSLFTGGIAGFVGRGATILAKEAAEAAVRKEFASMGVEAALKAGGLEAIEAKAKQAGIDAAAKAALKYEFAGALSGSALQNIPEVYQGIKEETGQESLGAAMMFGGFNSLLDAAMPLSLLIKARKAKIPGNEIVGEWYKRFGVGAAKGFATEGGTEAAQEMSSAAAEKFVDNNKEFFTEKNLERFLNAGLKGGLGGGVVSGSTDVVLGKKSLNDPSVKPLSEDIYNTQLDILARREYLEELRQQEAEEGKAVLTKENLFDLGITKKDPVFSLIQGKDLNNPQEAAEVLSTLQSAAEQTGVSQKMVGNYLDAVEVIGGYLSYSGEPDVGQIVEKPSGEGVAVPAPAVVPTPAKGLAGTERGGVVPAVADVGQPSIREGVQPSPVEPVQTAVQPPVQTVQPPVQTTVQPAVQPAPEVPSVQTTAPAAPTAAPAAQPAAEKQPAPAPVTSVVPTTRQLIEEQEAAIPKQIERFQNLLQEQVRRYGLHDVAVNVVDDLKNSNGQYSNKLIKLAVNAVDPVRDLRHESIHAMKELGVFTPAQWTSLVRMANDKWIDTYLKNRSINGGLLAEGQVSRHDAYVNLFNSRKMGKEAINEALVEEAIADAFGEFQVSKAPPGMLQSILYRINNFFKAIKETVGKTSPETAEKIFSRIEKGGAKTKTAAKPAPVVREEKEAEKKSLREVQAPPSTTARGVIVEVAPNPDLEIAKSWNEMTDEERTSATKAVANSVVNDILRELGLSNYSYQFSSGTYEGSRNPNIIIYAPESASIDELDEVARVMGYVLNQKAMVVFDEFNTTSDSQAGFVKVFIPKGMSASQLNNLRQHISKSVPQADGDTLRDGALLYGNFSMYNDSVETLSDGQYQKAIVDAVRSFDYDGVIDVSKPVSFHSNLIWPDSRAAYLEGTRYGEGEYRGRSEGADARRQGRSRIQSISEQAIKLRDRWIDARGIARAGSGAKSISVGKPTAEYGEEREGSVSAIGVHFSQQPRTNLVSSLFGTGLKGAEKDRLLNPKNADIRPRIYFYVDTGSGVIPESGVGASPHVIRLNNLYDTNNDPLKIVKNNRGVTAEERASNLERAIVEAGFNGFLNEDRHGQQGYAVIIGKHSIHVFDKTAEARPEAVIEGKASLRAPKEVPEKLTARSLDDKRVSPRLPTAVRATENPMGEVRLQPDLDTFKRDDTAFRHNIAQMSKYPNFSNVRGSPSQRAEQMIEHMKGNLLWLFNQWDKNLRDRSKLWYVGGNRIAHRWADKYGIPAEQAAAIIAALSPQKDWFQNVSLAERTLDALVFNADTMWTPEMTRVFRERSWAGKFPLRKFQGKTLKDMYVPGDAKSLVNMAAWIRAWDEATNPQTTRVITPEGNFSEEIASGKTGKPIAMRAQSFAAMVKTLQMMQQTDLRVISDLIGKNHKVRSFYNNIIAPYAGDDVTIDTHAVAAALMRPLGSSDLEVYHNFGSAKPAKKDKEGNILVPASAGTKNSAVTGLYGTYAMYAEAYRRAAHEAGVLPREMQSITWEAIRGLFRPEQKQAKLKQQTNVLWNKVSKGEINAEDARKQISGMVSGITDPAWAKSVSGTNESRTDSSYADKLPRAGVSRGRPTEPAGRTGERVAGTISDGLAKASLRAPKTDEFGQFFEGSKAVDAEDRPLVYYHASMKDKSVYSAGPSGAIFFSPSPEFAGGYIDFKLKELAARPGDYMSAKDVRTAVGRLRQYVYDNYGRQSRLAKDFLEKITDVEDAGKKTGDYNFTGELYDAWKGNENEMGIVEQSLLEGRNIDAVFINTQNPFDFADKKQVERVLGKIARTPATIDKLVEQKVLPRDYRSHLPMTEAEKNDRQRLVNEHYRDKLRSGNWQVIESPEVQDAIKALGHDGFYVFEEHTDGAIKNLAVYSSKQAKSAIGNVGAYGQRAVSEEEARNVGLTKEEAKKAQEEGDVRFSLREAPNTPEFKRWFGDSKVVDAEGKPLVVYHGTTGDFVEFKMDGPLRNAVRTLMTWAASKTIGGDYSTRRAKERATAWFTSSTDLANEYAEYRGAESYGANVMPVYLSIENPVVLDLNAGTLTLPSGKQFDGFTLRAAIANNEGLINIARTNKADGLIIRGSYDGLVGKQKPSDVYVAFRPEQIKSAIGNIGTFSPTSPDIRFSLRDSLGMYSELENKIAQLGPNIAPASNWKSMINAMTQKGVKPDEIEWSGVRDFLDLQTGKVTKDQILEYLKNGGVKVEETVLGGKTKRLVWSDWSKTDAEGDSRSTSGKYTIVRASDGKYDVYEQDQGTLDESLNTEEAAKQVAELHAGSERSEYQPKYGQYTLPGGENYREVLLTLPTEATAAEKVKKYRNTYQLFENGELVAQGDGIAAGRWYAANPDADVRTVRVETQESRVARVTGDGYQSKHWEPLNVIAHLRLNDRTDADGNKVLFVEEIQSDWGQEGKKKGFGNADGLKPGYSITQLEDGRWQLNQEGRSSPVMRNDTREGLLYRAQSAGFAELTAGIPAAPFVTKTEGWLNLALKRVMVMAAEGGYDKVAFVNGEQSADRFSLDKQVDELHWRTRNGSRRATLDMKSGDSLTFNLDNSGIIESTEGTGESRYVGKGFDAVVGKELADKVMSEPRGIISGDGLKVGGEGMKTFYDKIVPIAVNKLLPKVGGGKMGDVTIGGNDKLRLVRDDDGTYAIEERRFDEYDQPYWEPIAFGMTEKRAAEVIGEDKRSQQPGFSVTPEMKRTVETTGLPRFSLADIADRATLTRVLQTTTARDEKTFVQRMLHAISPETYSAFRAAHINRYNALGEADRRKIQRMGGIDLMADANSESAALMSDLSAGLAAGALGVYDKVGGIPVYHHYFVVEKKVAGPRGDRFIQIGGKMSDRKVAEALAKRQDGTVRERGHVTIVSKPDIKGPLAIFYTLAKLNDPRAYQAYQYWAGVKRGRKWVDNPDGTVSEHVFNDPNDPVMAKNLLETYRKLGVDFEKIQEEWIAYNDELVKFMLDTGVISKENAKAFTEHGDYLPFYRQINGYDDAVGPQIFQSIYAVKPPPKIKGGEAPLGDFLENIVRNTQSSIQAGVKNIAAKRARDVGIDVGGVNKIAQAQANPANSFYVLEDGKKVFYNTADQLFINALKSLNIPDIPFIGLLSAPANVLRNLVTKDPGFMLANMMRDSMSAWATSGVDMVPIAATAKNFADALINSSPEFKALKMGGVLGGYDYSHGTVDAAKKFGKELRKTAGTKTLGEKVATPFTSLWEALEHGTEASDAATRIEIFKKTMKETGNEAEALFRSLEVMNFNRKGSSAAIRLLTAAVPFLNARIQGLDVLFRAGMGSSATSNASAVQRAFWVRGMTLFALSSMYWMLTHDDDDYKKQEQETKDNNWLIPKLGIKIPIPFEVGILFKVIPERIMALTFGDDTAKDFRKSMYRNLSSTLAFTPVPQTFLPVFETVTNYSFFTGRSIVGAGMENIAPEYQTAPGTSRMAENLGKSLGISPMKIDHIIKGYTGTIGTYASDVIDSIWDMHTDNPKASKRFEQLPFFKRFLVDPEARGNVTAYYDMKHAVDEVVRTSNMLERSMDFKEYGSYMKDNIKMFAFKDYINDLDKTLKEYRDMKNMIRNIKMDADRKRDTITAIEKLENQLTSNITLIKSHM